MTTRKFSTFSVYDATPTDHLGHKGEITYRDGYLYYHDGVTPGGELINGGGSGGGGPTTWTSVTGKPSFATVATSGSYADLTNKPTIPTSFSSLVNGSKTVSLASTGKLTLPAGTTYEYVNVPLTGHGDGLARLDFTLTTDGVVTQWYPASASPAGSGYSPGDTFTFDAEFLGIPGASVTIEVLTVGAGGSVENLAFTQPPLYPADIYRDSPVNLQVGAESNRWTFGANGTLTLPAGGTINNTDGITLVTDRGTLVIGTQMERPGVAGHFHIAFDGSNSNPKTNDLFLGDDYNYVKLPGTLNEDYGVEIGTHNRIGGNSYKWRFGTDGTTTFPNNSIKNSLDSNTAITTQQTLTANNSYTNGTNFSTDVDLGGGMGIIAGWYQRNPTQIEFSLFGDSTFYSYLTRLALGRTVIVTYNTSGGTSTLTGTLTQAFSGTGQNDSNNPTWSRVCGRIDAILPAGQLGIVSINFPVYSTSTNDWTFGTDGKLTLPAGGTITEGGGISGAIQLTPAGGANEYQALVIYPTVVGDGDHIHLTAGGGSTELYLGSDNHYVKLTNTGNVEIRTGALDYYNTTRGVWTLDSDGVLTLPTHNNTPGSRIKSAVDITIETGPYYLADLDNVGVGSVGGGTGTLDFLISSAPDWATKVAVGDHVVSGTWTDIITAVAPAGDVDRWTVTFASGEFTGNDGEWSFYKPGAAGGAWQFGADGVLTLPDASVIASYKPVTVIAKPIGVQTIPDNASSTRLTFIESVDSVGAFTDSTFTVPYSGYYQFNTTVYFTSDVTLTDGLLIIVNITSGLNELDTLYYGAHTGRVINGSSMQYLTAGDTIALFFRQVSGNVVDIGSSSRLTIHRVSIG